MPSPLPRQARWNGFAHDCSIVFGLPQITVGSAPALSVSRPAQRSLTLQPADSPSRLMRPSPPEASAASLPPPPLRLLPGGAIQFPGGPFIPLWSSAFSRRTVNAFHENAVYVKSESAILMLFSMLSVLKPTFFFFSIGVFCVDGAGAQER